MVELSIVISSFNHLNQDQLKAAILISELESQTKDSIVTQG